MAAPAGASVLTFFEGTHRNVFEQNKTYDESRVIERIATREQEWDGEDALHAIHLPPCSWPSSTSRRPPVGRAPRAA